jgi:hypothetical protein
MPRDTDACEAQIDRSASRLKKGRILTKSSGLAVGSSGRRWTPDEDEAVRGMRQAGRSWSNIQRALPHRSESTSQVPYSTKLKGSPADMQ